MGNEEVLQTLRRQVAKLESGGKQAASASAISSGSSALDALLPNRGMVPGTLVEWVEHGLGSGSGWLAWQTAANALRRQQTSNRLVVIDCQGSFYPAIALAAGIPLSQIVLIRPQNLTDAFWAADQALRCPAVTAVWSRFSQIDDRQARRLQLAAEQGNTLGLWVLPREALAQPSWADIRWYVRGLTADTQAPAQNPSDRQLEVHLTRCRGGRSGQRIMLRIDSLGQIHHVHHDRKTAALPLVAQLANPTPARYSTGQPQTGQQRTGQQRRA